MSAGMPERYPETVMFHWSCSWLDCWLPQETRRWVWCRGRNILLWKRIQSPLAATTKAATCGIQQSTRIFLPQVYIRLPKFTVKVRVRARVRRDKGFRLMMGLRYCYYYGITVSGAFRGSGFRVRVVKMTT